MQDDLAISVVNVTKRYRMYKRPLDVLLETITRRNLHVDYFAVSDVNFSAKKGEIVGIIGRNGAGKSTLLKMISGSLAPTSGSIDIKGKVAAILELGTGFHPEYTGRENVYIGGMCLGLTREQVTEKLDDIIEFSELGEFIDRPFKTYSSGMQSRLTFATATSVDPDILIIDEALSVGDARFQRRSFARMERYRDAGKTILLVSHDTNTVTEFCDRAIFLEQGRVVEDSDDVKGVVRKYHEMLFGGARLDISSSIQNQQEIIDADSSQDSPSPAIESDEPIKIGDFHKFSLGGKVADFYRESEQAPHLLQNKSGIGDGRAQIIDTAIIDDHGHPTKVLEAGESYSLWMRIQAQVDCDEIVPGFVIRSKKGVDLYGFDSNWARMSGVVGLRAGAICDVRLRIRNYLANGDYFLTVAIADKASTKHDLYYDIIQFRVMGTEQSFTTSVVNLYGDFSWALHEK